MRRPLNPKEVALILFPLLGIGAFAFYQRRIEQVGGTHRADGISVASVEVKPAKGRFQADGLSHEIKVVVGHSWPRPSWWGSWNVQTPIDPLKDIRQQTKFWRSAPKSTLAYGAVLTTTSIRNGKSIIKEQARDTYFGAAFPDNQLIFSHKMALDKIPLSAGEVTFRGLYLIAGRDPLRVTRVVRKPGDTSRLVPNHNPNGRLTSTKVGVFEKLTISSTKTIEDTVRVDFSASRTTQGTKKVQLLIDDMELHDGSGKVLTPYRTRGFYNSWGEGPVDHSNLDKGTQTIWLNLATTLKTTNPLVLKGKISIDEGWPIPFSVRLPNR